MSDAMTIAAYGVRESMRRRVFVVVLVLTAGFLGLYTLGAAQAFHETDDFAGGLVTDAHDFTGATVFGLAMFATLFLGVVLAAFLTIAVVRGDAERGLLQPLVVRPVGRATLLLGRFAAAAAVSAVYVVAVYLAAMLLTAAVGDWWPDHVVTPGLALAAGVVVVCALSLAGSVLLTANANGIAVFMTYGAGLTAGLLGQIGEGIMSETLQDISRISSWALPFEALYQDGLDATVSETGGIAGTLLDLGPFGGAQGSGPLLWAWAAVYTALVLAVAIWGFRRRDL